MQETRWKLYIDESGAFNGEQSIVTGVAFPNLKFGGPRTLRLVTQRELPEVVWPPHASHCRFASQWLLWAMRAPSPLTPFAQAFVTSHQSYDVVVRALQALVDDEETQYADLAEIDELLKQWSGSTYTFIADTSSARLERLRAILRTYCEGAHAFGFLASVAEHKKDAYLEGLRVLLERVRDRLLLEPGDHTVTLHIAERDVKWFGKSTPLQDEHVASLFPGRSRVHFEIGSIAPYQDGPNLLVTADWTSNGMFGRTRASSLRYLLSSFARLGLASGDNTPHAAAAGVAARAIRAAAAGENVQAPVVTPPWAKQQAELWIQHFREGR